MWMVAFPPPAPILQRPQTKTFSVGSRRNWCRRKFQVDETLPGFLSFQKLLVGGDLNVQSQLDVHELLVLADLASHVLLGSLQGLFQVLDACLGVLHGQLPALLGLSNLGFEVGSLGG